MDLAPFFKTGYIIMPQERIVKIIPGTQNTGKNTKQSPRAVLFLLWGTVYSSELYSRMSPG